MTLIDSCDSILMLYSYSGFPEHSWAIFQPSKSTPPNMNDLQVEDPDPLPKKQDYTVELQSPGIAPLERAPSPTSDSISNIPRLSRDSRPIPSATSAPNIPHPAITGGEKLNEVSAEDEASLMRDQRVKMNMMSGLSIILTLMSILVAFRYFPTLSPQFHITGSNYLFTQYISDHNHGVDWRQLPEMSRSRRCTRRRRSCWELVERLGQGGDRSPYAYFSDLLTLQ